MSTTQKHRLLELANRFMSENTDPQLKGLGLARLKAVELIKNRIESQALPFTNDEKTQYSLIPLIFQEANYDGIDWFTPQGSHLELLFDIDFYMAFDGKERKEITADEFHKYAHETITQRQRRSP